MDNSALINYIKTNGLTRSDITAVINQSKSFPVTVKTLAFILIMQMSDDQINSMAGIIEEAVNFLTAGDFIRINDLMVSKGIPLEIAQFITQYARTLDLNQK